MRVLFWYCDHFNWTPAMKTLEDAPEAGAAQNDSCVVAFVHIEPSDAESGSSTETKLVKNAKWLARKWDVKKIILHSFTHLGEDKAQPQQAGELLQRAHTRLADAGYEVMQTPYGYFLDLDLQAPGHPLARVYKQF